MSQFASSRVKHCQKQYFIDRVVHWLPLGNGILSSRSSVSSRRYWPFRLYSRSYFIWSVFTQPPSYISMISDWHAIDPPYHALGYPRPESSYQPFEDQTLTPGEAIKAFALWVAGYYQHGAAADQLELRTALKNPPPTIATMQQEDIATSLHVIPDMTKFSDGIIFSGCQKQNLGESLRNRLLYPSDMKGSWANIKLKYIWCDMSVWEMPWGVWKLEKELEGAKTAGKPFRTTSVLRMRGCNHFVRINNKIYNKYRTAN